MTEITIENIIAHAQIANGLDINKIAEELPEFSYNPAEFSGLTLKLDHPKTAVLVLPGGKAICTGGKKIEDAETSINQVVDKIKSIKIKVKKNIKLEIQNTIVTTDLNKELHLSSISKGLLLDHVDYEPKQFPGLIFRMADIEATLIIFSTGKIVCTGTKTIEDATNAIETIKEKLTSIGAL